MRVLVTGSIAFDIFFRYEGSFIQGISMESIQNLSMSFRMRNRTKAYGGTGANTAWNLRLLGGDPLLYSTVGEDGGEYLERMRGIGMDTAHVKMLDGCFTACAIIATDQQSHQITFFHSGADDLRPALDLPREIVEDISYAIVQPTPPAIALQSLEWCADREIPTIFDPGQELLSFQEDELWRAIELSSGLTVNSYEWSILQNRLHVQPEELVQDTIFAEDFGRTMQFVIVTKGGEGFALYEPGRSETFPACPVENVVNPTGAGDGFRGGLLTGLNNGWTLEQSAKLGSALASKIVEQESAILESLDVPAIVRLAEKTYGETLPTLPA